MMMMMTMMTKQKGEEEEQGNVCQLRGQSSSLRAGLMEKATEGTLYTYGRVFFIYLFARGNFHHYLSRCLI